ncbi:MAG: hypothetical protein WDN24_19940 [Sphingomonas sp.]
MSMVVTSAVSQAGALEHRVDEGGRRVEQQRADAFALEVGEAGDAGGAPRDDAVPAFDDRHDDPQVGPPDRLAQQLRLGIGRDIGEGLAADQVDRAAVAHARAVRIAVAHREQDRGDLDHEPAGAVDDQRLRPRRGRRGRSGCCPAFALPGRNMAVASKPGHRVAPCNAHGSLLFVPAFVAGRCVELDARAELRQPPFVEFSAGPGALPSSRTPGARASLLLVPAVRL